MTTEFGKNSHPFPPPETTEGLPRALVSEDITSVTRIPMSSSQQQLESCIRSSGSAKTTNKASSASLSSSHHDGGDSSDESPIRNPDVRVDSPRLLHGTSQHGSNEEPNNGEPHQQSAMKNHPDNQTLKRNVSVNDDPERSHENRRLPPSKRLRSSAQHQSQNRAPVLIAPKPELTRLLASSTDHAVLSPLHAFVRQQIEVFTATEKDISQPAPGRKNPVSLHQVGLRCIHCRHLPSKEKVKRAVCYPSTVGRVYNSVSDMKFDHFSNCRSLPPPLRQRFNQLKDEKKQKRDKKASAKDTGCSSSTAQYYHDSAREMGMIDKEGGVFMRDIPPPPASTRANKSEDISLAQTSPFNSTNSPQGMPLPQTHDLMAQLESCRQLSIPGNLSSALLLQQQFLERSFGQQYLFSLLARRSSEQGNSASVPENADDPSVSTVDNSEQSVSKNPGWTLSCPVDDQYLNPIHCFVRRHVEFFAADAEDVKAPSPGRKTRVLLGQVGIRCIHCSCLPLKHRVKRSVCYPPSIAGVYHAVSNMKFDHFANCKGLPAADRDEFTRLRSKGNRKNTKTSDKASPDCGFANSTAQYYHDSALRMGLVDTADGIRFGRNDRADSKPSPASPLESASQSSRSTSPATSPAPAPSPADGLSALMIAATDLSEKYAGQDHSTDDAGEHEDV